MRSLILILLLLTLPLLTYSQESEGAKPDRWRGLVLDQSTTEDAIRILGQPVTDKLDKLHAPKQQQGLSKKTKARIFRVLEFKKPDGIDKAWLSFLDDKLVAIDLDVKKGISPSALSNIYGIEFQPLIGAADIAFSPRDYERNQGRIYPKSYPVAYAMIAVSQTSFISAMISNVPSFGGALVRSMGIPDQPGTFPGKVETVTLISRTLENKDGADVLK